MNVGKSTRFDREHSQVVCRDNPRSAPATAGTAARASLEIDANARPMSADCSAKFAVFLRDVG